MLVHEVIALEKKDVVRGQINTVILSSLFDGEKYGYEIRKEIELKTAGKFLLKEPTLYSSLKRLEKSGFVESFWGDLEDTNGGRRRYYKLTEKGRAVCEKNLSEWEYSRTLMDKLISDKEIDLATAEPPSSEDSAITAKVKRNYIRDIDRLSRETEGEEADEENSEKQPNSEPVHERRLEELESNLRRIEEANHAILESRENFDSRIQQIESDKESEQTDRPAGNFASEGSSVGDRAAEGSAERYARQVLFDKELPARNGDTVDQPLSSLYAEPERMSTVKDYSSFQSGGYSAESDSELTEKVNRFMEETRDRRAEQDGKDYKLKLGKLLSAAKSYTSNDLLSAQEDDRKVISFEAAAAERPSIQGSRRNDPLENEDLKALSSKIQAEGFKIKTYSADSSKDYKSFLLKNKINFVFSLILFAAFALELFLFHLATEGLTKQGFGIYGVMIGVSALYPLGAFIAFRLNPDRKTKAKFSFRESFINCVLIFAYAFLVVMALNLVFKVQFANVAEIVMKVFLPSFVALQLVVGCILYALLYHGNRFHT